MIARISPPSFAPLLLGLLAVVFGLNALRADEMTREVQEELRKRHLYFGDIDGRLTPEVSAALRRYQERKGFAPSGTADETTLRSLTLLPPGPADRSVPPLPDITVLRSDEGRAGAPARELAAPEVEVAAKTPPPLPQSLSGGSTPPRESPPATVPIPPPQPDAGAIRAFIERYLQAGQANDPAAELRFYGDRVDYFDDGLVDRQFIEHDVRRFQRRWPDRHFALASPVEVTPAPPGAPAGIDVRFRYRFKEKGNRLTAMGQVETEYGLTGSRPEDLHIISMREQRVRP
jgi:peptidoglycan hydrolase-like protein with peptidoglycan-binding domain